MKTVNIYVLHYENTAVTEKCVQYFYSSGNLYPDYNVVVIDNGSTVPYEALEEDTRVVRLEKNLPVVAAWNAGMQAYPADLYFLANNDVVVGDGCIQKLIEALEDESIGIVAAGTSDTTVGMMHVAGPDATLTSIDMNHVDGHLWGWRQDLVDAIGYPDCDGHTHQMCWGSNRDYSFRARQAGYRVVCVRSAFVDHQRHESYDRGKADAAGHAWLRQKWGELAPLVEA